METFLFFLILASGLYMAWNIGANDVANAMGTSVGSGALTLKAAIFVAGALEFSGAFFFGSHVSETMQQGIVNSDMFINAPIDLVLGMLSALIGTGIWLQIASYFGWPVSTTHAIVGAIVGFGVLIGGVDAVYWDKISFIALSWILSPLSGALLGYLLFNFIRRKIFYAPHPLDAAKKLMPYLSFAVFFLLGLFLFYNGLNNLNFEMNFVEALGGAAFFACIGAWTIKRLVDKKIPASPEESKEFEHTKMEFDNIERMFGWLQVTSACMMAFAHGANDVANAIGPLSAALFVLSTKSVSLQPEIPPAVLALGGFGIVLGLATWGWRVIETIGKKLTELTPTRGFSAEFGAAATILIASRLGLPISTTHTLVGAVIGIGLARGIEAINLGMTRDIVLSWLVTLPAGALTASLVFLLLRTLLY